jgi:hypothetical protein
LRAFLVRFPTVALFAVFLAAAVERRLVDFFADLFVDLFVNFLADFLADVLADFLTDFLADFLAAAALLAFFTVRFGAGRFLAGATATGGTIIGSETRPSAASGT